MTEVRLIATGGTIASRRDGSGHLASVGGADLLAVASVPPEWRVEVVDAATVGSFAWQWTDLLALLRQIAEALSDGVDAVVVTHGTDTMEEVAFLAGLVHADSRPVVFTGAQRPFDHVGADGPANLSDALVVAGHPLARNRGVLVVFDGHVYPARGTTKRDTLSTRAFHAPGREAVLRVAAGQVYALAPASRPEAIPLDLTSESLPRVDIVPMYVGTDAVLLRAAVTAGASGIVLAAFGAGNANPVMVAEVAEAVRVGVVVMVCSRVGAGPVLPLYSGGGGADLAKAGVVFGGDLSPWQGRMLLAAALASASHDPQRIVRQWLAGDTQSTRMEAQ